MKAPAREAAKKTRTDRSICIACKQKKQGCMRPMESPNSSCVNCVKHASKRPGPCSRAFFDDIVSSGALNYISSTKDDKVALLLALGNMPSRATYSGRNIDPEAAHEEKYLVCAAHLARIIARKVEVEAYTHLQTRCHNANQLSDADLNRLLQNIGLLLVSLRWRHTWWGMLGDGTIQCEPYRGEYEMVRTSFQVTRS
ncbi:hypothetical protein HYQ45_017146 [Verticillium longisporum]|uniref:Uncharacterized protein n=1 Tax=Verticillium longisporum TaxID=100787 RepID=A0A8I2Z7C6_VERLO|nr:hypothetical protein HYQ45_017146 [Verticillium longisporum]